MRLFVLRGPRYFRCFSLFWLVISVCFGCESTPKSTRNADAELDSGLVNSDIGSDVRVDGSMGFFEDLGVALDSSSAPDGNIESDRSGRVYERTNLLVVNIEMDRDDYNSLRFQRRAGLNILEPECALPPSPYTWFPARISINGETVENVGIRKKGFFGSVSASKPSFKVKFDKYVDDQTYFDMKRLTLNNSRQDPSFVRQCLSYDLFRAAGIAAPRCNFAHVYLNGDDLGVYVNVESLKKPFVRRNFEDDEGNLYEGTLSDFRDGWTGTIRQKTNEDNPDFRSINALADALQEPDERLLDAVSAVIDLDSFLTFWAMEIMVAHWDGYSGNTNNFHFYDDPTTRRLKFIPWGTDGTFQTPIMFFEERRPAPRTINAAGLLCRRLYLHPEGRQLYLDRLTSLIDSHWRIDVLEASIDEMVSVFADAVRADHLDEFYDNLSYVLDFLPDHGMRMRNELAAGPIEWPVDLRQGLCQSEIGAASGQFETTWGSFPNDDLFETGTGMLSLTIDAEPITIDRVGSAIGLQPESEQAGQLLIPMILQDGQIYFFIMVVPISAIVTGAEFNFESDDNFCGLNLFNPRTNNVAQLGGCHQGRLIFDEASTVDGAPVRGRFNLSIWAGGRR